MYIVPWYETVPVTMLSHHKRESVAFLTIPDEFSAMINLGVVANFF